MFQVLLKINILYYKNYTNEIHYNDSYFIIVFVLLKYTNIVHCGYKP